MSVTITNVNLAGGGGNTGAAGSIRGVFTGGVPTSLSSFYRGGGRVPLSQANVGYGLIATSGAISMGTFRGAAAGGSVTSRGYGSSAYNNINGNDVGAAVFFAANGTVELRANGTTVDTGSGPDGWYNPTTPGIGSSFWIRARNISLSGGGPGVLSSDVYSSSTLSMNLGQQFSLNGSWTGSSYVSIASFIVDISTNSAGTNIVASHTISLEITVEANV